MMTHSASSDTSTLRKALLANGVFSSICSLGFLAARDRLASLVGAPQSEITQTGVALIVFVGLIAVVSTRRELLKGWVLGMAALIALLDLPWVVTTPFKLGAYTTPGKWIFGSITLAVLALVQTYALVGIYRTRRQRSLESA